MTIFNHVPRGFARGSVTKTRVPRDTKAFKPHVEARKAFGALSNVKFASRGIEFDASDIFDRSWRIFATSTLIPILPVCYLRGREWREAFSCDRRSADKFSCRPKGAFVTDATTQPRGTGLTRTAMTTNDAEGIRFGGSGERANRATRDVVAPGSWLKTAGAVRYRLTRLCA